MLAAASLGRSLLSSNSSIATRYSRQSRKEAPTVASPLSLLQSCTMRLEMTTGLLRRLERRSTSAARLPVVRQQFADATGQM